MSSGLKIAFARRLRWLHVAHLLNLLLQQYDMIMFTCAHTATSVRRHKYVPCTYAVTSHVMSFCAALCFATRCYVQLYRLSCYDMPCHVISCHVMLWYVKQWHVELSLDMVCYAMTRHAMLCRDMLCFRMPLAVECLHFSLL